MKNLLFGLLAVVAVGMCVGCATQEEEPVRPVKEIGKKLERGLSGEGQVTELDRSDDPFVD